MKEQFYDLSIETLGDGTIRLEQHDYSGESVIIDLHPQQAIHIANGLSVDAHQTQTNETAERITTLGRRLRWLRDRFAECHAALPSDMHERCPEAFEFDAWLTASIDVSSEFCADIARTSHDYLDKPLPSPLEAPSLALGDSGLPEYRNGDLFADKAEVVQV